MKTLKEISVYAVHYRSLNDGHNICDSYWTSQMAAENRAKKLCGTYILINVYQDSENRFYKTLEEIPVDIPNKEDVLAKLTRGEKISLGLEKFK